MAKALSVPSVEPFSTNGDNSSVSGKWDKWLKSFRYFVTGSGVTDRAQKRALLLHLAGPEVQQIFETLENTGADNDFDRAIQSLDEYFKPKKNVSFERHKFNSEKQNENETVQEFTTRLKQLALTCEFEDTNDRIKDQIVEKCSSSTLRRKFLCEKNLTLDKALELASTYERAQDSATKIENGHLGKELSVNRAYRVDRRMNRPSRPNIECYNCGKMGHYAKDQTCPARNAACNKCKKLGHFSKKCRAEVKMSRKRGQRNKVRAVEYGLENPESGSDCDNYTFMVSEKFAASIITVNVGKVPLKMLIDSGSSCNIVDRNTWEFLKSQKPFKCLSHEKSDTKLFAYGSQKPLQLAGKICANVEGNDIKLQNVEFVVLEGKGQSLLSRDTSIKLDVLRIGAKICQVESNIEKEFPNIFTGIGKLKDYQLHIPIDETVDPVVQSVRRIPYHLKEKVDKKLESLEEMDIIEKVTTSSRWVSPVVVVPKGDAIRLCLDMRLPNMAIKRVRHTIPTVDDVLQEMNGCNFFSKIDIRHAYHQIELDEPSREITTFVTHNGQYRYKRLMFGVSCASEMYQNVLQQILQGCENTRNIMDDIIVYAPTQEQHDRCLRNVMKVLSEKGLTLNREKCQFNMSKLEFMGNVVSEHGVGPSKARVQDVLDARAPQNASEVRSFLGLVNFNARYIRDISTVSEPLRQLTRKGITFKWTGREQSAFEELKGRLASAKTLGYFDKEAKTQVICDASPVGISAMLVQEQNGDNRVICYASRSLSKVERKYSQVEKECISLIFGVERFHIYLFGAEFELLTDCKALQYLFAPRSKPSARTERWILRIQSYKFKVKHIKGSDNVSDCLSRLCRQDEGTEAFKCSFIEDDEYVKFVARNATPRAITTRDIEKASRYDAELIAIRHCIANNAWDKLPYAEYLPVRHELTCIGFLVLRGTRIVVPKELREQILQIAHESHPGIVLMKANLRQNVYWPGIDKDAEKHCKTCYGCQLVSNPTRPEEMTRTELPNGPWEHLAIDWLGPLNAKDHILVVVDYYSRFIEIGYSKTPTSDSTIKILQNIFSRHGNPISIQTDGASYFTSALFEEFLLENGIKHRKTTPLWPSANGEGERQNRSLLKRIKIAQAEGRSWKNEIDTFLLMYRSSVHSTTGVSPAELLFGRKIRSKLPNLQNHRIESEARDRDSVQKEKGKIYNDKRRHACESSIEVGDKVLLKQQKQNKLDTNFASKPYVVRGKFGNRVTIERDGVSYHRNITAVKKLLERDEMVQESLTPPQKTTSPIKVGNRGNGVKRKTRTPSRFSDYV